MEVEMEMGTETKTETRTEARIRIRTWGQVLSDGVHKLLRTDLRWAIALIIYSNHNPCEQPKANSTHKQTRQTRIRASRIPALPALHIPSLPNPSVAARSPPPRSDVGK
jgi:hypothetical protein